MNQPWICMCSPSWTPPTSLPIPSLWVILVLQPRALVSCIQPGLAICFTFDSIHVSMLFSQIIPCSPSPIECKSLGICTEETRSERDTCTPVLFAAPSIIARTWKQPRCPSADEWIRKLWYIYTMEYYWAIKKYIWISSNEIKWMFLKIRKPGWQAAQGNVKWQQYQFSLFHLHLMLAQHMWELVDLISKYL